MDLELDGVGAGTLATPGATLRQVKLLNFDLHLQGDTSRAGVESYIRRRFQDVHGAEISHFMPMLVSVGMGPMPCAAVGLAAATRGPLFLEQYLATPVEQAIANATGTTVARSDILEIGNLVSTWKGSSLLLFVFLSELIAHLGHRFVLFTATAEVERLLARLGYAPEVLATADPTLLPDRGAQWGRYYQRCPRVMFGDAQPAIAMARRDVLYRTVASTIAPSVARVADIVARH